MAQPTDREPEGKAPAPLPAWGALGFTLFRLLWLATIVSNIGSWMYSAASAWLMTSLNPHPLIVSLVQAANSLPLFLFALPAGALADMVDKRRFILVLEILTTLFSLVFALLVGLHAVTPGVLLLFLLLIGTLGALETPAWQAIVPLLVPKEALSSAVAVNSLGVNISRVIGPALAGVVILAFGIAAPFWLDAVSNAGVIAVLLWWCPPVPAKARRTLPAEHLTSAIRTGVRYASNNRGLRATLVRAAGFFLFASAYWALLPVVARTQLHGSPTLYGVLLGAIGAGAVVGALSMPRLKARSGANGMVVLGELGNVLALLLFGLAQHPLTAVLACLIAGLSWIVVLATLNVSAQVALPDWVRGRGLAAYVTVFFGTMSLGSALWGFVADRIGLPPAHYLAAAGAFVAIWATRRWKLQTGPAADLTPSMHWPEPVVAGAVEDDAGPVMVTVEYRVNAENRAAFLHAVHRLGRGRRRGGAYTWGVFEDMAHPGTFLETFLVDSWLEHLRQHQRVTKTDQALEDRVSGLTRAAPRVTHYLAPELTAPAPRTE
jgi:predicted MFS family arabinose efflux permease